MPRIVLDRFIVYFVLFIKIYNFNMYHTTAAACKNVHVCCMSVWVFFLYRWRFLLSCSGVLIRCDCYCKVASNRRGSAARANGRLCGTVCHASNCSLPASFRWSQWVDCCIISVESFATVMFIKIGLPVCSRLSLSVVHSCFNYHFPTFHVIFTYISPLSVLCSTS